MNFLLKENKIVKDKIKTNHGSVLPLVLFFSSIAFITVFSYILHQMSIAKPSLRSPSAYQSLLNARSGIYKGFAIYVDSSLQADTLKTISTLDSLFSSDLFDSDSITISSNIGSEPSELNLFTSDSFGDCEVSIEPSGSFLLLRSTGRYRDVERVVEAKLGSKLPAFPDTVLVYHSDYEWEGPEPDGILVHKEKGNDAQSPILQNLVADYDYKLAEVDSILIDPPLTIMSSVDLKKVSDTVNGSLLLDGSYVPLKWKNCREIIVRGDVQFTGDVNIDGISFIAAGEIRILDKTEISNSSLYSQSRIFMGDFCRFKGDALAKSSITVYGNAVVHGKSTLVSSGSSLNTTDTLPYSIFLGDEAIIDGVCMALSNPGGIKTDHGVVITGILWANGKICHRGKMQGLMLASQVIDCDAAASALTSTTPVDSSGAAIEDHKNSLPGKLSVLGTINEYRIPFYSGIPSIIDWKEDGF